MEYLNGYFDCVGNFNGCLTSPTIEFDEHDFSNDDLRLFQEFLTYCLIREECSGKTKRLKRFEHIAERYHTLSKSAQNLVLMDARKLERYEHATGKKNHGKQTQN